jgi:hypothetical protein
MPLIVKAPEAAFPSSPGLPSIGGSPALDDAYGQWLRTFVDEANAAWLDRNTGPHGELPEHDLILTGQLTGHLFGEFGGLASLPADRPTPQYNFRHRFVAIAFEYQKDAVIASANAFVQKLADSRPAVREEGSSILIPLPLSNEPFAMSAPRFTVHPSDPPALAEALSLLSQGLWPIAVHALGETIRRRDGSSKPSEGVEPIGTGWGLHRPTEASLRAQWASKPKAAVGLLLGHRAGVVDIEVDKPELAEDTLLEMMGGECWETRGWQSRRGGHFLARFDGRFLRYGKTIINSGGVGPECPGIEIRVGSLTEDGSGQQFQSVVPPSPDRNGNPRTWNDCTEIMTLPDCFFDYLDARLLRPPAAEPQPSPRITIPIHGSHGPATSAVEAYVRGAVDRVTEELRTAQPGQRHKILIAAAAALGNFVGAGALSESEAESALIGSCQVGGFWDSGPGECLRTIQDGLAKGRLTPRDLEDAVKGTRLTPFMGNSGGEAKNRVNGVRDDGVSGDSTIKNRVNGVGDPPHSANETAKNRVNGVPPDGGPDPQDDPKSWPHDPDETPIVVRRWPDAPHASAFRGLAGELVESIDPHTESDPVAVLIQLLVAYGNLIGRHAHFSVEAERHYLNLFACIVGLSSKGRKGTSWAIARWLMASVDPDWTRDHVLGGLTSGEGMIWAVRDPITKKEPIKERGKVVDYEDVIVDAGVEDKRALFLETEMGRVLKVLTREGNTLSDLIRQAWETGLLRTSTKNSPARATDAHISILGHITSGEANRYLTQTEAGNGFGNRFLWACVKRSKVLPFGNPLNPDAFQDLIDRLRESSRVPRDTEICLTRDDGANALWLETYAGLSEGKPGLLGSILGRAEAQVMRLACLYALLDGSFLIRSDHLESALALWRYCEDSARFIFGDSLGDKDADFLLSALRSAPLGLTRNQIRSEVFGRNKSSDEIAKILGRLLEAGRVRSEVIRTAGAKRPSTLWFAVSDGERR